MTWTTAPIYPFGIHTTGMDVFVRDELELGTRAAHALDDENNAWGAEGTYWWLTRDWDAELGPPDTPVELEAP